MRATTAFWYFFSAQSVLADWQYRSRPDLTPAILNITIPATADVEKGFVFVAPYDGPEQPAAYIFRDNGDLVWSSVGYLSGFVGNFQVMRWKGQDVLQAFQGTLDLAHGHGWGQPTLLGHNYEVLREFRPANHRIVSVHEFDIVHEETAIIEAYQPVPYDLTPYGGSVDQQWIVDCIFQEVNIETGELVFEWHSLDHVNPADAITTLTDGHAFTGKNTTDAWDYFHINSIHKDDEGHYLVSGRHVSTIFKLDSQGNIIWRLGGKHSNFTFTNKEAEFAFQHDARFRSRDGDIEIISFFDNAARIHRYDKGGVDVLREYSSGKYMQLNYSDWTATLIDQFIHPDRIQTPAQGNVQLLPNGNNFVNWGSSGSIVEFRANDSQPVFAAYLDSNVKVQNYRGFRFNWTGTPNEAPAIVSLDSDEQTTVYVSWNGDTETSIWRFYAVPDLTSKRFGRLSQQRKFLGEVKRTSFETILQFSVAAHGLSAPAVVFAEAIDAYGNILTATSPVISQPNIEPYTPLKGEDLGSHNGFQEFLSQKIDL